MNPLFDELYTLYEDYNSHTNLSAIRDKDEVYKKHFLDSLQIFNHCNLQGSVIDIGTGGGFPALALAIQKPELKILAIDSTAKKIKFVTLAKEKLGLSNLQALCARAEELAHDDKYREKFDFAVSRAVAELRILLELATGFVKPGGKFIAYKKTDNAEELQVALNSIKRSQFKLLETIEYDVGKQFLVFEKTSACAKGLPREFKQIKKTPL